LEKQQSVRQAQDVLEGIEKSELQCSKARHSHRNENKY